MNNVKKWPLLCGLLGANASLMLCGCSNNQPAPAPPPPATLTAQEQQAVNSFKTLSPAQQQTFLRNNPKLAQNPLVIAQMRDATVNKR